MWDAYTIDRHPETGLMIVEFHGVKIGSASTTAGARIIRRRHYQEPSTRERANRMERMIARGYQGPDNDHDV